MRSVHLRRREWSTAQAADTARAALPCAPAPSGSSPEKAAHARALPHSGPACRYQSDQTWVGVLPYECLYRTKIKNGEAGREFRPAPRWLEKKMGWGDS